MRALRDLGRRRFINISGACLCGVLLIALQVRAQDWVHLGRSDLGIIVSYDASSIRETGEDTVEALVMLKDDQPDSFTFGHSAILYREVRYEINCVSDVFSMIEVKDFYARGYSEVIRIKDKRWDKASGDPILGKLYPIVCPSEKSPKIPATE